MKKKFVHYTESKKNLDLVKQDQANAQKELDYNRFLLDELDELP
jgi:DNA repair ATPase RecN